MSPYGQYEFLRTPFELCNSPVVVKRRINYVFRELINNETMIVYMDDVIISSANQEKEIIKLKIGFDCYEVFKKGKAPPERLHQPTI